jgi:single-strand DNA-binding protein
MDCQERPAANVAGLAGKASTMIRAFVSGRVGNDAELKYTQSGMAVATFSIASDNGKGSNGEKKDPTWITVKLWDKKAEGLSQYITKGKYVVVSGPASAEAWVDRKTGEARSKLVITCYEFEFGGGGSKDEGHNQDMERRVYSTPQPPVTDGTQITDDDIPF